MTWKCFLHYWHFEREIHPLVSFDIFFITSPNKLLIKVELPVIMDLHVIVTWLHPSWSSFMPGANQHGSQDTEGRYQVPDSLTEVAPEAIIKYAWPILTVASRYIWKKISLHPACWWTGNRPVSQMWAPLVACRELAVDYDTFQKLLYVFGQKRNMF